MKKSRRVALRINVVLLSMLMVLTLIPVGALELLPITGDADGFYHHDYTTGETDFIAWSEVPQYDYTCTYDCLDAEIVAQCQAIDAQYFAALRTEQSAAVVQTLTDSSPYTTVHPYGGTDYLYSGVVLIVAIAEQFGQSTPISVGSGFVVGGDVVLTAAHVTLSDSFTISEIRVYPGVDHDADFWGDGLENYSYYTITNCYRGTNTQSNAVEDPENDWCIAIADGLSDHDEFLYNFNCYSVNSSIIGTQTYAVGYPNTQSYRMAESSGYVYSMLDSTNRVLLNTNPSNAGMSGGPLYAHVGGRSAIAINSFYIPPEDTETEYGAGGGPLFTSTLLNLVYDAILEN